MITMNEGNKTPRKLEDSQKSVAGTSPAVRPTGWKKFLSKRWVFPAAYMAAAAIIVAAGGAAAMLTAYFFQYVLKYQPCPLCLDQRVAYYVAIPLAGIGPLAAEILERTRAAGIDRDCGIEPDDARDDALRKLDGLNPLEPLEAYAARFSPH